MKWKNLTMPKQIVPDAANTDGSRAATEGAKGYSMTASLFCQTCYSPLV